MRRRSFLGLLFGAAIAPKTTFSSASPSPKPKAYFGGRVETVRPQTMFRPERIVLKLYTNSLYGKFGGDIDRRQAA